MNFDVLTKWQEHATECFPNESCGFIIDDGSVRYIPLVNQASNKEKAFLIDPTEFVKYQDCIKFICHSHVNATPEPSDADKAGSERTQIPYAILNYPDFEYQVYQPNGWKLPLFNRQYIHQVQDCWTFVVDYYKETFDIDVPQMPRGYVGWWDDAENQGKFVERLAKYTKFKIVSNTAENFDVQPGDLLLLRLGTKCPAHCLIVSPQPHVIAHHSISNRGIEEIFGDAYRKRVVAIGRL